MTDCIVGGRVYKWTWWTLYVVPRFLVSFAFRVQNRSHTKRAPEKAKAKAGGSEESGEKVSIGCST